MQTTSTRTVAAMVGAQIIKKDQHGRFCLNDMHKAAGGAKKHQPTNYLQLDSTQELMEELSNSCDSRIKPVESSKGRYGGTYAVEDLALSYAMWISPKFHLTVVRAFKEFQKTNEVEVDEGSSVAAGAPLVALLEQALQSEKRRLELEKEVEENRPKVELAEATMAAPDTLSIREVGKRFGLTAQALNDILIKHHVLYRERGKSNSIYPYQKYIREGYFVCKTYKVSTKYVLGRVHATGKGLMYVHNLLKSSQRQKPQRVA